MVCFVHQSVRRKQSHKGPETAIDYCASVFQTSHTPKFDTAILRITPLRELESRFDELPSDQRDTIVKLEEALCTLRTCIHTLQGQHITFEEWQKWEFGLKSFRGISFKGLRSNYCLIAKQVVDVYKFGYIDSSLV